MQTLKITTTEIAEKLIDILGNDDLVDMSEVETSFGLFLACHDIEFLPYDLAVKNNDMVEAFDSVSDYFFDAVNARKISTARIETLLENCLAL